MDLPKAPTMRDSARIQTHDPLHYMMHFSTKPWYILQAPCPIVATLQTSYIQFYLICSMLQHVVFKSIRTIILIAATD